MKESFMIDLHVHTTMSDGTLSPEEVVRYACDRGLTAIAVTDHDTLAGIGPARKEAALYGLEVIPGVEISTQWSTGIMHILGYFVRPEDSELLSLLAWLSEGRRKRIPLMLDRLSDLGIHVSEDEIRAEAIGGVPGRPHVANLMLRKGYVHTVQEAFDMYLKKGAPAYVVKTKLEPAKAIRAIAKAGGVPVLAHPYSLREGDPERLRDILTMLKRFGLRGIEAYYSRHTIEQTETYLEVASTLRLVVTGGSDFHGSNKPDVEIGVVSSLDGLPYSVLQNLKSAWEYCPASVTPGIASDLLPEQDNAASQETCTRA